MPSAFITSIRGYPAVLLAEQPVHRRYVHPGPLVLRTAPLKYPAPTTDRDRTVSRRSEPSSRTTLIGGQPNPWDLLQAPGCDEPTSRCQTSPSMWTLGGDKPVIPRVTFVRWAMAFPFNSTGSLSPTFVSARYVYLPVKLPSAFTLFCAISVRTEGTFGRLRYSFGGDRPSQTARLTLSSDQFMITS